MAVNKPYQPSLGESTDGSNLKHGGARTIATAIASVLAALAASSCCVIPLVLFTLGVSGAWIGNVTALAPYQPVLAAVTLGLLGYGYYLVYGKPQECAAGE
ncbi:MAG: mercuric transporter MerT family protein, partial [Gammaproteobacteria bacterium]